MSINKKAENPFEIMKLLIEQGEDFSLEDFAKQFSISESGAKAIWLSCPYFQENFCRERIISSRESGHEEYGSKMWLKRRYELSDQELTDIFGDIWASPVDQISSMFLSILTTERIAETQLTPQAKQELAQLQKKFDC